MEKNVSFDSLPAAIMELAEKVDLIINLLPTKVEKRKEIPKYLSTEKALDYLRKIGFPMSKSRLYKLTAAGNIPFHKSGNMLLFTLDELAKWCKDSIQAGDKEIYCNNLIIKTAQKVGHKTKKL